MNKWVADYSSCKIGIVVLLFLNVLSFVLCQHSNSDKSDRKSCTDGVSDPVMCSTETKLVKKLLQKYKLHGTTTRPIHDSSQNLTMWYGMRLLNMKIDEKTQTLTISVWVRMKWYDELLTWNRTKYDVYSVMVPQNSIWRPASVTVTNTIHTKIDERKVDIKVRHDGRVLWFPQREYKSECLLNLRDYPHDVHTCTLWVQSLSWSSGQMDLQPYYFNDNTPWDLDTYVVSQRLTQEWEIISNTTSRVEVPRKSAILMYSRRVALKFTLTIRRRPGFISYLLRYPVVILSFMCVLIFCLPVERPDRNMLAMSLFTSYMILLLILVDSVPPSAASIPKLVYLYCAELANVVACIACSVSVIHLSRRGETGYPPPRITQRILFGVVAKVIFIHKGRVAAAGYMPHESYRERSPCLDNKPSMHNESTDLNVTISKLDKSSGTQPQLKGLVDTQWKLVAFIMDRVFCIVFLLINIIIVSILFPRP